MKAHRWMSRALAAWLAWALVGLVWTPHDPRAPHDLHLVGQGASWAHWMGVDWLGRDVFSRVWLGSGATVGLGASAALGSLALAALLLALERRGPAWLARLIHAGTAAALAFPVLFVGMLLLVFLPGSAWTLVLACAVGTVPLALRQLRVLWREQQAALYLAVSRGLGGTAWHQFTFSIWPNLRPQAWALVRIVFAVCVLELSGLSFLGLAGDPDQAELGVLLRQHQAYLFREPMLVFWPGILLTSLLLLVHLAQPGGRDPHGHRVAG